MIDFEGNISEPLRRTEHRVIFDEEDDGIADLAITMTSVTTNDWEANVDGCILTAFVAQQPAE